MSITVRCVKCGTTYPVKEKHAGKRFQCRNPGCSAMLDVPAAPQPNTATAPGIIALPPSAILTPAPANPPSGPFSLANEPTPIVRPPVPRRGVPVWVLAVIFPVAALLLCCGVGIGVVAYRAFTAHEPATPVAQVQSDKPPDRPADAPAPKSAMNAPLKESPAPKSAKKAPVKESPKKSEDDGLIVTDKARQLLNAVPIKAHQLMTQKLEGTLVQAEYMGKNSIGFSGAGFKPATCHDWSGFYIGKAIYIATPAGQDARDQQVLLRSFTIRAVITYENAYEVRTKVATDAEVRLLKERGYIK